MKAFDNQNEEAIGFCTNCGKTVGKSTHVMTGSKKLVCSSACNDASDKFDRAIDTIYSKTLKQNKVSAYGCFLLGIIFVLFGIYHIFFKFLGLGIFLIASGIGLILFGKKYSQVGTQSN